MDAFSARIRELRGEQSQTEFGEQFGLGQGNIAHLESGRSNPSIHFLLELSQYYNVTIDFLLKNEDLRKGRGNVKYKKLCRDLQGVNDAFQALKGIT